MKLTSININIITTARRTYLLAFVLIAMALLPGCKKYLDITPVGRVMPQTLKDYRAIMTEAYASANKERSITAYRSDEIQVDNPDSYDLEMINNPFTWNENGIEYNSTTHDWRGMYKIIFYTNVVIHDGINAKEGARADIDQLVGEAYLLRAYTYFILVNTYGAPYNAATAASDKAVPLVTAIDLEKVSERNSVKEIYDFILSDISEGKKLLNLDSYENKYSYRFTTVAADALEARVNLYMKNYQASLDAAKRVLVKKSGLVDLNAANSLLPNDYTSSENILALEKLFPSGLDRPMRVSEELKALYNATDLRKAAYFTAAGNFLSVKKVANDKYRSSFRTGEIYLIASEASAGVNNYAAAKTYLNQLKKVRFTPDGYTAEESRINQMPDGEFAAEIANERARELAFEGHRWFDLRRTTRPRIVHKLGGKEYVLNAGDTRYTILIPRDAILNNSLLLK